MDRIDHLQAQIDALAQQTGQWQHQAHALDVQTRTLARQLRWWRGLAGGLLILVVLTWALPAGTAQEEAGGSGPGLAPRLAALEQKLRYLTVVTAADEPPEVRITGANLHIVNGLGQTDCGEEAGEPIPDCPNGVGNLIVGYNELRGSGDVRTGSHNVVVGQQHNFSRFGGVVVGLNNEISGDFAAVGGGLGNAASGDFAAVSGGRANTASGGFAAVSGGFFNTASSDSASVSGGADNVASGLFAAAVNGGRGNTASGFVGASVSGGFGNTASGEGASVSGGQGNTASGDFASVSGGLNRTAAGDFDWVAGSLIEDE
jgi:hypothetical protein